MICFLLCFFNSASPYFAPGFAGDLCRFRLRMCIFARLHARVRTPARHLSGRLLAEPHSQCRDVKILMFCCCFGVFFDGSGRKNIAGRLRWTGVGGVRGGGACTSDPNKLSHGARSSHTVTWRMAQLDSRRVNATFPRYSPPPASGFIRRVWGCMWRCTRVGALMKKKCCPLARHVAE